MNDDRGLDLVAQEIVAMETETFAIADYSDVTEAVLASTSCSSSCSTCSATTSSTSCAA